MGLPVRDSASFGQFGRIFNSRTVWCRTVSGDKGSAADYAAPVFLLARLAKQPVQKKPGRRLEA